MTRGKRRRKAAGGTGPAATAEPRARKPPAAGASPSAAALPVGPLLRNLLIALVPAVILWLAVTPFYDRFLIVAGENLVHVVESPDVTDLLPVLEDPHYAFITRTDFPPSRRRITSFRVTDLHFHLVLLAALFLAVPGVPWRRRLANLGWALLITVFFHLLLVVFWVKFVYATQLGAWSLSHYGAFARNFWGLGKHLLDLPIKLAFPLLLWAGFYLPLLGARD